MTPPGRQNIALFGGSFNPVHIGHMIVAQYVAQFTDIHRVWMLVSPQNPLKPSGDIAPDGQRLEMLEIACNNDSDIIASDFEFSLPKPSYTYNTLQKITQAYPELEFSLLIGADNWLIFDKWRDYDKILANHRILIYPRPGYPINPDSLPENVSYLAECPVCSISSTFIRNAIKSGRCVSQFLPNGVYNYILKNNIY